MPLTLPMSMSWALSQVGRMQERPPSKPSRRRGRHRDPWTQAEVPAGTCTAQEPRPAVPTLPATATPGTKTKRGAPG